MVMKVEWVVWDNDEGRFLTPGGGYTADIDKARRFPAKELTAGGYRVCSDFYFLLTPEATGALMEAQGDVKVHVWSNEYRNWWQAPGEGNTMEIEEAEPWPASEVLKTIAGPKGVVNDLRGLLNMDQSRTLLEMALKEGEDVVAGD